MTTALLSGPFGERRVLRLAEAMPEARRLPWPLRVLLAEVLRQGGSAEPFRAWLADGGRSDAEIAFRPARILMHDTTCGPALVDLAALRDAVAEAGGDPARVTPMLPVDVSVDHSVAVDVSGVADAMARNMATEFARNAERYGFMKWAAGAFAGRLRVFPPGAGILHSINLERLATVIATEPAEDGPAWAVPDTLLGTDSHTPMINGIGVLGWGVGGLEAEAAMLGLPLPLRLPEVVGVRLTGRLPAGVLATDLVLVVTERLRAAGMAGEFVAFFGPGVATLTAMERAVVANMAPEYGASTACFPVDRAVLGYLAATGRPAAQIALVEAASRALALWREEDEAEPLCTRLVEVALDTLSPSVAGPHRPQDRRSTAEVPALLAPIRPRPAGAIPDAAIAIAAITSCTNTTDPALLVAAGLLARAARARGLKPPPWVKTSLTPGSPAAAGLLARTGLDADLDALGFQLAGVGCATCIGNSGPLLPAMAGAVASGEVRPVAVLSGNRNFPGRVHRDVTDGFLASPPLVVAYALAGDAARDVLADPLGQDNAGQPVRLADLWPSPEAVASVLTATEDGGAALAAAYASAESSAAWAAIPAPAAARYPWDDASTYLRRPPFARADLPGWQVGETVLRPLLVLGDDITTDHISPAGAIPPEGDAGRHLVERGADPRDLNVFAARRGNFEVMLRGLFTNRTVRNLLGQDLPPGATRLDPGAPAMPLWQAAVRLAARGEAGAILAGARYGAGSSRDWAAKGVALAGVRAVLATSFERIHVGNLIGMGVLPVLLPETAHPAGLGVAPGWGVSITLERLAPRAEALVTLRGPAGEAGAIAARLAIGTEAEAELLAAGGMLPFLLRRLLGDRA